MTVSVTQPYEMTISLNVLNHLGINLYSNVPAVISEAVANAWDADASEVRVMIDVAGGTVSIADNGHGMTRDQVNGRFLNVGFERRKEDPTALSPRGRQVMGRKGIGKLSLFSVANDVDVYTIRDGERSALTMSVEAIRNALDAPGADSYHPEPLPEAGVTQDVGTRILLRNLKKGLTQAASGLRTRLARRFSILGAEHGFRLYIGDEEVTIADRDYFHKLQYVWAYGDSEVTTRYLDRCRSAEKKTNKGLVRLYPLNEKLEQIEDSEPFEVHGWIGTTRTVSDLKDPDTKDNLNKIGLIMRGKLAHEDLLEEFNENGVYASYLIGELAADFLDDDDEDDIATSSRQRIIEDDPRYRALAQWLRGQVSRVGSAWLDLRNGAGRAEAFENPLIEKWFESLPPRIRPKATKLFGKIGQLTVDTPTERRELFAQAVLGFENLRYRENLEALDTLEPSDLKRLSLLFGDISDIQAAMYHRIVHQRLEVIDKLRENVEANALEAVLQEHLYDNLWLLDPGWERATDWSMEETVGKAFAAINSKLSDEERKGRIDIRYKRTGGVHVIVELKRAGRKVSEPELVSQVEKYRTALRKYLRSIDSPDIFETICVVGQPLIGWDDADAKDEQIRSLAQRGIRVVQYQKLLADAQGAYRDYLDAQRDLGRVAELVQGLAAVVDDGDEPEVTASAVEAVAVEQDRDKELENSAAV